MHVISQAHSAFGNDSTSKHTLGADGPADAGGQCREEMRLNDNNIMSRPRAEQCVGAGAASMSNGVSTT